jgi:hypothetical protein
MIVLSKATSSTNLSPNHLIHDTGSHGKPPQNVGSNMLALSFPLTKSSAWMCCHGAFPDALFAWFISHQSAVLFFQNKPATSNQPAVLFSQNKSASAISHQPNEQAVEANKQISPYASNRECTGNNLLAYIQSEGITRNFGARTHLFRFGHLEFSRS